MLFIEITKIELTGGLIGNMPFIEIAKLELSGGHIDIVLFIEICQISINRWPHLNYAIYRDGKKNFPAAILEFTIDRGCQNGISRRP